MRTVVIFLEIFSGGLLASRMPARTKPQLATGPQKCTVFGPTGEFTKAITVSMIIYSDIIILLTFQFKIHLNYEIALAAETPDCCPLNLCTESPALGQRGQYQTRQIPGTASHHQALYLEPKISGGRGNI